MLSSNFLITVPLLLILSIAALCDWRTHKIPNVLTFGAALFGLILQSTVNGAPGLAMAASGWVVCLVCFLPFYARGGMAAGDVKLMAAAGAFIGPVSGVVACVFTLIAGGVIGLIYLAVRWSAGCIANSNGAGTIVLRDALRTRIPYAGAIAMGTSFVLLVPSVIPPALIRFGA